MCGRVLYNHCPNELRDYLELLEPLDDFGASYNVAPTDAIPAVRTWGRLELTRWGLTMPNPRASGINVRRESLGIYAGKKRVLIVVSGFYEWRSLGAKRKQPFAIYRADGAPLVLAGLDDSGGVAIVTAPSSGIVATLHDRMPVVLEREAWHAWLDPAERAAAILGRASAELLAMHAVSNDVGDLRTISPRLLERVDELPIALEAQQLDLFAADRSR